MTPYFASVSLAVVITDTLSKIASTATPARLHDKRIISWQAPFILQDQPGILTHQILRRRRFYSPLVRLPEARYSISMGMFENPVSSYDLHLHTYWSFDATAEPESYFRRASELGISCIAITEHHGLDSVQEISEISRRYAEITAIRAAELSVTTSIGVVDLLCYGFPKVYSEDLKIILDLYRSWLQAIGEATWKGMQSLGYDFSESNFVDLLTSYRPATVLAVQGNTEIKYHVLRSYFMERGFIFEESEYDDLINRAHKVASAPLQPDVDDVIPVVKRAGAVVAIAHPFVSYFAKDDERRMDMLREECALDGIECAHPTIPPEYGLLYRRYCLKHGLFSVGGSDSHGHEGKHMGDWLESKFGRHGGKDEWLDEFLDRIIQT